jgi:hypothetical protein
MATQSTSKCTNPSRTLAEIVFDVTRLFGVPRMRRTFAGMPAAPDIKMNVVGGLQLLREGRDAGGEEDIHILVGRQRCRSTRRSSGKR